MVEASLRGTPAACARVRCDLQALELRSTYLELLEGETAASAYAAVILDGRASDDGSQLVDWARGDLCGLGLASLPTADLAGGL